MHLLSLTRFIANEKPDRVQLQASKSSRPSLARARRKSGVGEKRFRVYPDVPLRSDTRACPTFGRSARSAGGQKFCPYSPPLCIQRANRCNKIDRSDRYVVT